MNTEIDELKAQVKELTLACAGKDMIIKYLKDDIKMLKDDYKRLYDDSKWHRKERRDEMQEDVGLSLEEG